MRRGSGGKGREGGPKQDEVVQRVERSPADVVPLVLDTYGGINKAGLEFINRIYGTIAGGDRELLKDFRRSFRESLAFARVRGQGRLIESWNRMNRFRSGAGVGGLYLSV